MRRNASGTRPLCKKPGKGPLDPLPNRQRVRLLTAASLASAGVGCGYPIPTHSLLKGHRAKDAAQSKQKCQCDEGQNTTSLPSPTCTHLNGLLLHRSQIGFWRSPAGRRHACSPNRHLDFVRTEGVAFAFCVLLLTKSRSNSYIFHLSKILLQAWRQSIALGAIVRKTLRAPMDFSALET